MAANLTRVYADTSVYGGVADEEFAQPPSQAFFDEVREGRFRLVISALVREELQGAPGEIHLLFEEMRGAAEIADITEEALQLQRAYLQAGILMPQWQADALHVATATVARCQLIVSWNFKHIVHFEEIPLYNGVNLSKGYNVIALHTPQEVIGHEDENV